MESREDCLKRYGQPLTTKDSETVWIKAGVIITAVFHDKACQKISYEKTEPKGTFSDAEIEVFLDANRNGRTWKKEWSILEATWKTTEGWYVASYDTSHKFTAMTAFYKGIEEKAANDAAMAAKAKKAAAEKKKLEGF